MNKKIFYLIGMVAFVALVIALTLLLEPFDGFYTTKIKIYSFTHKDHAACLAASVEWEPGKKLGLCEKNESGISGYSDAFFYDSSDELMHPNNSRSPAWRKIAQTFLPEFGGDGEFTFVTPLGGHFYFVEEDVSAAEGAHFF